MEQLFDEILDLPDPDLDDRYSQLVGLDELKERLAKHAQILLNPDLLREWSQQFHSQVLPVVDRLHRRPPLILFEGDVGTGKTTLAESFGSRLARDEKISIKLMELSLATRGLGAVGEMTQLISRAFEAVIKEVKALAQGTPRKSPGKLGKAVIFVIDEADALAQSREIKQIHHEDRAGVNALIRGIDRIASLKKSPVLIVMCTNRGSALDPAIVRRAAARFPFGRPSEQQRLAILEAQFGNALKREELETLAKRTGPNDGRAYGYTCSDLTERLIPEILLAAFPDRPVSLSLVKEILEATPPTRPFSTQV